MYIGARNEILDTCCILYKYWFVTCQPLLKRERERGLYLSEKQTDKVAKEKVSKEYQKDEE